MADGVRSLSPGLGTLSWGRGTLRKTPAFLVGESAEEHWGSSPFEKQANDGFTLGKKSNKQIKTHCENDQMVHPSDFVNSPCQKESKQQELRQQKWSFWKIPRRGPLQE